MVAIESCMKNYCVVEYGRERHEFCIVEGHGFLYCRERNVVFCKVERERDGLNDRHKWVTV